MRAVRTVGSRGARQRAANPPPSAARRADGHSHGIFARTGDGAIDRDVTHGDTCCRAHIPTKP